MANTTRTWLVRWIYLVVVAHLVAGVMLPLLSGAVLFDGYREGILRVFFDVPAPDGARAVQLWWMSLFGPTVQAAAIWMLGLAVMGDQQKNAFAWAMLILGLLVWAPQDMAISAQAHCWANVALDVVALVLMLPPLFCLCKTDLNAKRDSAK